MRKLFWSLIILSLPFLLLDAKSLDDRWSMFLAVLDGAEYAMTGADVGFDRLQFHEIVSTLTFFDKDLYSSQENGWRGMVAYYQQGGGSGDAWGGTQSKYEIDQSPVIHYHL